MPLVSCRPSSLDLPNPLPVHEAHPSCEGTRADQREDDGHHDRGPEADYIFECRFHRSQLFHFRFSLFTYLPEAQQRFEKIVVAVVERRIDLAAGRLVTDAVLEEPVADLVALGEVFGGREGEELLDRMSCVAAASSAL